MTQDTCNVEGCLNEPTEGGEGYCPKHVPKPWWRFAVDLQEDGKLDVEEKEATNMVKRHSEVFR